MSNNNAAPILKHNNNERNSGEQGSVDDDHSNDFKEPNRNSNKSKHNFAALDIIQNEAERDVIKCNQERIQDYMHESNNFFYNYSVFYTQRKAINELNSMPFLNNQNSQAVRSNIRVLIIVGSSPSIKYIETESFYEDAEDYTIAFLISHLFHYAFLIPYSQILITLTNERDFWYKNTKTTYNEIDETIKKSEILNARFKFMEECAEKKNFCYFQNVNYAQVGTNQYKFDLEYSLLERVKLFDKEVISHELNPNDNSDIFLFFIDHSSSKIFSYYKYQFFIDTLLQLNFNHFYVMNDSCNSGSLIEIIRNSNKFEDIFLNKLDQETEYNLLKYLFEKNNINSEKEFNQKITPIINENDYEDKIDTNQMKIMDILHNLNPSQAKALYDIVNNILNVFPSSVHAFTPKKFVLFGQKSTIFCSSDSQSISLSLPGRRISCLLSDNYRICGSIFSSIFIESLLNANSSIDDFKSSIKTLFQKYKNNFEKIIKKQNKNLREDEENPNLASEEEINNFFDMALLDDKHFYITSNMWPNLQSIFINDTNYWNVDASKVDSNEYKDLYICNLKKGTIIKKEGNEYGPLKGMSSIQKFQRDFEKAVKLILEKERIKSISFDIIHPTQEELKNKYKNLWYGDWAKFIVSIRPYITSKSGYGIMSLKYSIAVFFNKYPDFDKKKTLKIFQEAFHAIFPSWKDHSLYH